MLESEKGDPKDRSILHGQINEMWLTYCLTSDGQVVPSLSE